jgi:hypothetical protein
MFIFFYFIIFFFLDPIKHLNERGALVYIINIIFDGFICALEEEIKSDNYFKSESYISFTVLGREKRLSSAPLFHKHPGFLPSCCELLVILASTKQSREFLSRSDIVFLLQLLLFCF